MSDQYSTKGAEFCPECEETSFCNSEGREIRTPYMNEECCCQDETSTTKKQDRANRCHGMKNPYFKQTCSLRTDVYRNKGDKSPVDTISMEHTASASLCALAIAGSVMLGTLLICKCFGKKA